MSKKNEIITDDFFNNLERVLANQNAAVLGKVGELSKTIDEFGNKFDDHDERINRLENDVEISTQQRKKIRNAVHRRVWAILELPQNQKDWDEEDFLIYKKYAPRFYGRCWSEVKRNGHLVTPYEETPKKYYDDAMRDIEAWFPLDGIEGLKSIADKAAAANKKAEEEGYIKIRRAN